VVDGTTVTTGGTVDAGATDVVAPVVPVEPGIDKVGWAVRRPGALRPARPASSPAPATDRATVARVRRLSRRVARSRTETRRRCNRWFRSYGSGMALAGIITGVALQPELLASFDATGWQDSTGPVESKCLVRVEATTQK